MDLISCPVKVTCDIVSGKWKPLIIYFLKPGRRRYSDLKREIPGPSHKVLTQQLRQLEQDGIVSRRIFAEIPPRVEYSLTPYGRTLIPVLAAMARWGGKHAARLALHDGLKIAVSKDDELKETA